MAKEQQKKPAQMKRVRITGVIRKCYFQGILFEKGNRFKPRELTIPEEVAIPEHLTYQLVTQQEVDDLLA